MVASHRARVEALLMEAALEHTALLRSVPAEVGASLPVDAQGITRAIDQLAVATGFTPDERRKLVKPHAVNPAVMHARVFGAAPLTRGTIIGAFVDGARVRADALVQIADAVGDGDLSGDVRTLLVDHPLPSGDEGSDDAVVSLRDAYAAQERAALLIAAHLDSAQWRDQAA